MADPSLSNYVHSKGEGGVIVDWYAINFGRGMSLTCMKDWRRPVIFVRELYRYMIVYYPRRPHDCFFCTTKRNEKGVEVFGVFIYYTKEMRANNSVFS